MNGYGYFLGGEGQGEAGPGEGQGQGGPLAQALMALMQAHERGGQGQGQPPQGRLSRELLATLDMDYRARSPQGQPGGGGNAYQGMASGIADAAKLYMQQQQGQPEWGKAGYGVYQPENTGAGGLFGGASGGLKSGYGG